MWKFKSHLCSFRLDKLYVPQYFLPKSNKWDVSNTFIKGAADPAVGDCSFSLLSDSRLVGQADQTAGLWGPVVLKVNLQKFRFPAYLSLSQLQNQLKLDVEATEVLAEYHCSCFFWPETVTSSEVLGLIGVVVYTFVVVVVVFGGGFVSHCFSQGHLNMFAFVLFFCCLCLLWQITLVIKYRWAALKKSAQCVLSTHGSVSVSLELPSL